MDKGGQISLFVIIAIVIVAVVAVIFLFPRISVLTSDVEPNSYLRDCIEKDARANMESLALQGGYSNPESYVMYQDNKFTYLCYTSENYKPCLVQQPLIKNHFEEELKSIIEPRARQCAQDLKVLYERKGYAVESDEGELNVNFVPGKLNIEFDSPLAIVKDGSQTFRRFSTSLDTEMYDLLLTSTSMVQFESTLGDTETLSYIQYYPDLKIEKLKRDGDTLYTLSNVVTGDKFSFSSRSLVFPPGYGLEKL